jgi:hypothetical protein
MGADHGPTLSTGPHVQRPGAQPRAAAQTPSDGSDSLALFDSEEHEGSDGVQPLTAASALDVFPSESADSQTPVAANVSKPAAHEGGSRTRVPRVDMTPEKMPRPAPVAVLDPPAPAAVERYGDIGAAGTHSRTTVGGHAGRQWRRTRVAVVLTTVMLLGWAEVLNVREGWRSATSAPALPTRDSAQGIEPARVVPDAERTRTAAVPSPAMPESVPALTATTGASQRNAAIESHSAIVPCAAIRRGPPVGGGRRRSNRAAGGRFREGAGLDT